MSDETNEPSIREQRVNAAIAAYLEAVDAGETPDPRSSSRRTATWRRSWSRSLPTGTSSSGWPNRSSRQVTIAPTPQPDDVTLPPAGDRTEAPTIALVKPPAR